MTIPLANAIFDDKIDISEFIKPKLNKERSYFFKNLNFLNVDKRKFHFIKLKHRLIEHKSTPNY